MPSIEELIAEATRDEPEVTPQKIPSEAGITPTGKQMSMSDLLAESRMHDMMKEEEPSIPKVVAKGLLRSGYNMIGSLGSMAGWFNEMIGLDELAKGGFQWRKRWEQRMREGWAAPDPRVFEGRFWDKPSIKRSLGIIAEAVPTLGAAVGLSMATGTPWLGAAGLGLMEGAPEYQEMRERGLPEAYSGLYAGTISAGIAALEYLPIGHMLGAFKKYGVKEFPKGFLKGFGLGAAEEGIQEASQQVFQNFMAQVGYDDTRMLFEGITEAIIGGAGSGGMMGGTVGKLQAFAEDHREKNVKKILDTAQKLVEDQMKAVSGVEEDEKSKIISKLAGEFDQRHLPTEQDIVERGDLAVGQRVLTPDRGEGIIREIDKNYVAVQFPGQEEAIGYKDEVLLSAGPAAPVVDEEDQMELFPTEPVVEEEEVVPEEPAEKLEPTGIGNVKWDEESQTYKWINRRLGTEGEVPLTQFTDHPTFGTAKQQAKLAATALATTQEVVTRPEAEKPTPIPADPTVKVEPEKVTEERTADLRNDPFFTEAWAKKQVDPIHQRTRDVKMAFLNTEAFMESEFYDGSFPVPEEGGILAAGQSDRYKTDEAYRQKVDEVSMEMADVIVDASKKLQILMGQANTGLFGVSYNIQQVEQTGKKVKGKYTVDVARAWNQEAKVKYPYVYQLGDISIREALQNSLDAVMRAKRLGEVKEGVIDIEVLGEEDIPATPGADIALAERFYKLAQEKGGEGTVDYFYDTLKNIAEHRSASDLLERTKPAMEYLGVTMEEVVRAFGFGKTVPNSGYLIDDNGIGMSDVDIRDRFLALHGTGKDVEGEFGGFGIAKAVILGPSDSAVWTLHTRDNYFTHSMAQNIEEIGTTDKRQGTRLEVRTDDRIIHMTASRQYVETTRPPKGIKIRFKEQWDKLKEYPDPFKGKRRESWTIEHDENTSFEITYFPKPHEDYNKKLVIRLVGKTSGAKLTQAIRDINDEGFSGALLVDITTTLTPSHKDYPLDGSRMNFKYGAPRDAITKLVNKMSTDKATAARVGIKSRKHSVKDRYEWKKTLKKIKKHKKYQNLLKVIREIYEETEEFYGHGPQLHIGFYEAKPPEIDPKTGKEILRVGSEEFYSEGPVTPLEQMEVHIDVGAKKLGGSVIHALHLTAMEAAARLLSGPLGASMTKFYSLVSVPKDGKIVGARYHALTGEFGLNHTVMDKTSLKSVDAFAQYLKARCAHEFAHAYAGPHDEEFSIAREQLDGMAADYLKYLVRISEAVFGKHSELREVVVEKEKIVEVPVERVVEREVERQIEVLVNDPEQMELFAEQEIGGYGGSEQEIFLSPESQRQLRLWPSEDDRLATGWGSTERIDGAGRGVQQPPAQSSPDTREGRLRSRVHPAESSGVAEADLPDSFSNPPERRGLWRGVRNWLTPRRKLKTPDKMSKPWKKALKDTPQYSIHRLERPVVTHYTKKGEEPKTSMKVFLVSIPDNVDALLTDGKPEIVFSNVEEARGHNVNPERLKDWLQLYDANIKLKKGGDFWGKPNDGKLQGVTILFLTKGCQRVPTTIERVELGILPAHSRLESCYEGMCFVNYKRYTLYGQIENMEVRDLAMADPTKLDGWLKRANIAKLNDTPFIREGSGGDSSHAFATDAAESWLHHSPRRGIEVPTVFISSGYAPVTDERYGRLRPYSDQFVAHFSVSGWFTRNEIMMRLAEFQAARDAGIPAAVRVITNRDNLPNRYGKLVDMARNEEFLFNLLGSMRLMQAEILETPYHDDTVSRLLKEHRSTPSGEFENVCAETGRCMSCGVKCLVNKLLGGRYGKGKVFVPAQYSLERGKPPIETVRTITHVGAVEESPNDDWRKMKVGDDLVGQGIGLAEEGIAHDYIDLGEGRDFLEEQRGGDVTILHFIPDEPMGRVGLVGPFQISDQHSIERWREALINSGSAFIYVYGGIDEISGEKLGDLPGYTREDIDDVYGIIGTRYTRNVPQYQMVDAQDRFITRRVNNIRARLEEWSSDPEGAGIEPQRQAEVQGEAASFLIKHDMGIPFFDEYASWQGNQGLSEEELVNSYRRRYGKMRHLGVGDTRVSIGSKITQPRDIKIEGMYERLKQQALSVGGWVAVEEDGKLFKTSMPVTIGYGHPTPAYKKTATGDLIVKTETREKQAAGQQPDIEPFGVYMLHDTGNLPDDWQKGIITLRSPLVIKFNLIPGEAGYDENSWKANLVRAYGGMTGYDLRETMMAEGFDSIVAVGQTLDGKPMGVKEIVYFGPKPHYYHARAEDPRAKKVGLARVTVEDLQKVFPKQRLGIAEDGSIWVETKAGLTLQIRGVEEIEPNSYALNVAYGQSGLEAGEQILGEYNRGVIRLQKDAANRFTLAHESMHWLEDVGILDSKDVAILRGTIQRLYRQGKFEPTRDRDGNIIDLGGTEDRANFLAEQIFAEPSGALDKIVKKIREFIDQLVNLVMRTSGGVVRDIKTGQMYDKGMAAGHTVNVHALASKAGPIWTSQLKDWIIRVGPNRATPQEWIKTLQRATKKPQNFKQEELKWSGIIEWLEDQQDANLSLYGDRISKDIVVQWLSAHNIKVVDRTMVGGERERRLMLLGETPQAFEPDEFDIYLVGDTWHVDFQELGTPWGDWEDINPQELREMMGQPGVPILHEDQIVALENWQRTRQIFTTRHMDSTPQTPVPFQWSAETPIGNFQIERRVHYNDDLEIQRVEYVLYKDGSELWRDETYNVYSEEELERLLTTMIDEADENLQADFHFTEGDVGHGARHQQYTSPGSYENYEELLLEIPTLMESAEEELEDARQDYADFFDYLVKKYPGMDFTDMAPSSVEEQALEWYPRVSNADKEQMNGLNLRVADAQAKVDAQTFSHYHWQGEKNFVVHVRFNERLTEDGQRLLYIEEIQSDWHGDARKMRNREVRKLIQGGMGREEAEAKVPQDFGYVPPDIGPLMREARASLKHRIHVLGQKWGLEPVAPTHYFHYPTELRAKIEEKSAEKGRINEGQKDIEGFDELWKEWNWLKKRKEDGNPMAPFRSSYPLLAMKRMIRWAAENGYDMVGWTPGWVQVDRWARTLRQHVDKISWIHQYAPDWTPAENWSNNLIAKIFKEIQPWWRQYLQDPALMREEIRPLLGGDFRVISLTTDLNQLTPQERISVLQAYLYKNPDGAARLQALIPDFAARHEELSKELAEKGDPDVVQRLKEIELIEEGEDVGRKHPYEFDLQYRVTALMNLIDSWTIPVIEEPDHPQIEISDDPLVPAPPPAAWLNGAARENHRNKLLNSEPGKLFAVGNFLNLDAGEKQRISSGWLHYSGEALEIKPNSMVRVRGYKEDSEKLNKVWHLTDTFTVEGVETDLEGLVGPDVYQQIIKSEEGSVEGEGLTIGGEQFKAYYDKMIRTMTERFITHKSKGWDSKGVENVSFEGRYVQTHRYIGPEYDASQMRDIHDEYQDDASVSTALHNIIFHMGQGHSFQTAMDEYGTAAVASILGGNIRFGEFEMLEVPAFVITPQMAKDAMEGFPQFQLVRKRQYPDFIKKKFKVEDESLVTRIKKTVENVRENWRQLALDRLNPILEHLGEQPYMLHRLETGIPAALSMFVRHGKLEWEGGEKPAMIVRTVNQGFINWLEDLQGEDAMKLLYWVAAKRAEHLSRLPDERRSAEEGATMEKWLDADTRREIFEWVGEAPDTDGQTWESLNNTLQEWNKSVLDLAMEAGLINSLVREEWEQHYYLPFFRVLEDVQMRDKVLGGPRQSRKFVSAQIFKLYGAEMQLGNPFENLIRMWTHLIHESQRNVARASAFWEAQKIGAQEGRTPILEEVSFSDIHRFYSPPRKEGQRGTMTFVTQDTKEPVLAFLSNGKRVYFKVHDPALYAAMSNINAARFEGYLMDAFRGAKKLLTGAATFSPGFRIRNMFRDTLHVALVSGSFTPFLDTMKGFAKAMREDEDYVRFMASMGGFGSSYVNADDPKALARYVQRIIDREGRGAEVRILDSGKKILNFWQKIGAASENAARVQLYANLRKQNISHLEAAFQARDLLDFTMRGDAAAIQLAIAIVPFMNARSQGLFKLGRAARENPKSFARKGMLLAMASLVLWWFNRDKEEYKELEDWEKWNYYHFWIGGEHWRLPKPFEVGAIFSSLFESAADVMAGDEELEYMWEWLKHTAQDNLNLVDLPALVKPAFEQWGNKVFYTGRDIVPTRLERLPAGYQAEPWTPLFLQILGEKFNISPRRAEALARGYLAAYAQGFFIMSDWALRSMMDFPEKPRMVWEEMPVMSGFIRRSGPARRTKYETRFYDLFREVDELYNLAAHYRRSGDIEAAKAILDEEKERLVWRKPFIKVKTRARKISNRMRYVMLNREMSPDEKRKHIDDLAQRRNELMKLIYDLYRKEGP